VSAHEPVRLVDLRPSWIGAGGPGIFDKSGAEVEARHGVGVTFDCPCGKCGCRASVFFENPLDGRPYPDHKGPHWSRAGTNFADLTVRPSILQRKDYGGCGWHGYLTNGRFSEV